MKAPSRDQLLADILSDLSWKEIAEKYGYSDSRFLRKLARRYDLPYRRKLLKPSEADLRRMIQTEGMTPVQVAEKLGYSDGGWSNIYAFCREYHIDFDFSPNHEKRAVPFTPRQKEIALGSLLGDAYLHPHHGGTSYSLSFSHGEKQLGYLAWKRSEFANFVVMQGYDKTVRDFHGNAPVYSFRTISHPYLSELHALCYPGGVKRITPEWLELLSPLSLAVWYLDDGSLNRRYGTIVLCTNCFSAEEHRLLTEYFLHRYALETKLEPRRNGQYVLRINASQREKFFHLIGEHIPDCMRYKLGEF